jgi:hypothetical protein
MYIFVFVFELNLDLLSDGNRERLSDLQLAVLTKNTTKSCVLLNEKQLLSIFINLIDDVKLNVGMVIQM